MEKKSRKSSLFWTQLSLASISYRGRYRPHLSLMALRVSESWLACAYFAQFTASLQFVIDLRVEDLSQVLTKTGHTDNDMVEESHACKTSKDAYFVASSNSPGMIITIVQLKENDNENNYAE
ncbi:hypothetical protein M9H77_02864 [Catharanthus roseus]|uniref:Uncharacterized protein n=1 Tax=Catharanthus roseus TaxID=4058 RepID=A0ACC0C9M6_CATRO|nr:hypothetical protein M9H77_02864 [Catharanthus roseus]